jgi:hypothetical protein
MRSSPDGTQADRVADDSEVPFEHPQKSLLLRVDATIDALIHDIARIHSELAFSIAFEESRPPNSPAPNHGTFGTKATEELGMTLLQAASTDSARSRMLGLRDEEARKILDAAECVRYTLEIRSACQAKVMPVVEGSTVGPRAARYLVLRCKACWSQQPASNVPIYPWRLYPGLRPCPMADRRFWRYISRNIQGHARGGEATASSHQRRRRYALGELMGACIFSICGLYHAQRLCRETLVWRHLDHPFVLPLVGVDADAFASNGTLDLISPWMERGTLCQYIESGDYQVDKDRYRLVRCRRLCHWPLLMIIQLLEIAEGLWYLHSEGVVHGDIHWVRIPQASTNGLLTGRSVQCSHRRVWLRPDRRLRPLDDRGCGSNANRNDERSLRCRAMDAA